MNQMYLRCVAACFAVLLAAVCVAAEPKPLFAPAAPGAAGMVTFNGKAEDVTWTVDEGGIDVNVVANGKSGFPGVIITPPEPWDVSGNGHVEARITNKGQKPIRATLRIDNAGPWQEERWSGSVVGLKPGETKTVSAIFGYRFGQQAYALDPKAITKAIIFIGKSDVPQSFRIEAIQAAGEAGEKPYVDPNTVAVKPPGGSILGEGQTLDAKQLVSKGGAKAQMSPDGKLARVEFTGQGQSVLVRPVAGMWNLNQHLQVRLGVKNTGTKPAAIQAQLQSKGGTSAVITGPTIAPASEGEIVIPFAAAVTWKGPKDPDVQKLEVKKNFHGEEGTGTRYTSNTTTGIVLTMASGSGSFEITSIKADMPPRRELPQWLGKRPPVDGDWTMTFDENFSGESIDLKTWNIYTAGEWHLGAQTHYSKDNVIVKDGKLALRVEKKRGHHNDNPAYAVNDYATGYADTFGKWTQRYGYFEARMKLPTANSAFTAFWLMPDRGLGTTIFPGESMKLMRHSTRGNGMEIDIMETLSIWGPNRHDFGMHWDNYDEYHKATGTFGCYVQPDEEGFITVGLLWTPGELVMYDNGVEAARWENPRVSQVPSYFILDHITGGWETEAIDDRQLPSDFVFDYVRAWQRKDLASPVDGPKPNDGSPAPKKE